MIFTKSLLVLVCWREIWLKKKTKQNKTKKQITCGLLNFTGLFTVTFPPPLFLFLYLHFLLSDWLPPSPILLPFSILSLSLSFDLSLSLALTHTQTRTHCTQTQRLWFHAFLYFPPPYPLLSFAAFDTWKQYGGSHFDPLGHSNRRSLFCSTPLTS